MKLRRMSARIPRIGKGSQETDFEIEKKRVSLVEIACVVQSLAFFCFMDFLLMVRSFSQFWEKETAQFLKEEQSNRVNTNA